MSWMSGLRKALAADPCSISTTPTFTIFSAFNCRSPRSRLGLISGVGISGLPEPHGLRAEESFTFSSARLALAPSKVPGYGSLFSPRSWSRRSCNGVHHHPTAGRRRSIGACGPMRIAYRLVVRSAQRARSSGSHCRNVDLR